VLIDDELLARDRAHLSTSMVRCPTGQSVTRMMSRRPSLSTSWPDTDPDFAVRPAVGLVPDIHSELSSLSPSRQSRQKSLQHWRGAGESLASSRIQEQTIWRWFNRPVMYRSGDLRCRNQVQSGSASEARSTHRRNCKFAGRRSQDWDACWLLLVLVGGSKASQS